MVQVSVEGDFAILKIRVLDELMIVACASAILLPQLLRMKPRIVELARNPSKIRLDVVLSVIVNVIHKFKVVWIGDERPRNQTMNIMAE